MKITNLRILMTIPVFGFSLQTFAFTAATPAPTSGSANTQAGASYIVPGQGGNAAEAGRSTSTMQYLTAGLNGAAAAMYAGQCSSQNYAACFMAGVAGIGAVQSLQSGRGANSAGLQVSGYDPSMYGGGVPGGANGTDQWGNTGDSAVGGVGDGTGGTGTASTGGTGLGSTVPQTVARDLAQVKNALDKSGVKLSPDGKTMTTPDGRTFDMSRGAGSSAEDLMALGFSAAEAAAAMEGSKLVGKKVAEKFKQMSQLAGVGGGGGGGRGIAAEGGGGDGFSGFDPFGRDRMGRNRKKVKVSGLTKKLGSDTIGVAGDDIFEMVTRRYKARDDQNSFLKD